MSSTPRKFIITCPARTGSTMLRLILDARKDVHCAGEQIWGDSNLKKDPVTNVWAEFFGFAQVVASGGKSKYNQLLRDHPKVLAAMAADPSIHVIHLWRDNLLKRYVSNRIAAKTKVTVVQAGSGQVDQQTLELDVDAFIDSAQQDLRQRDQILATFKHHPMLDLLYEELADDPHGIARRIESFLGLEHEAAKVRTRKINSNRLQDIITNFDEVARRLKGTPYERFLS